MAPPKVDVTARTTAQQESLTLAFTQHYVKKLNNLFGVSNVIQMAEMLDHQIKHGYWASIRTRTGRHHRNESPVLTYANMAHVFKIENGEIVFITAFDDSHRLAGKYCSKVREVLFSPRSIQNAMFCLESIVAPTESHQSQPVASDPRNSYSEQP